MLVAHLGRSNVVVGKRKPAHPDGGHVSTSRLGEDARRSAQTTSVEQASCRGRALANLSQEPLPIVSDVGKPWGVVVNWEDWILTEVVYFSIGSQGTSAVPS